MTQSNNKLPALETAEKQALIIAYIYGELDQTQQTDFAQRLVVDAEFNQLYIQQQQLDKLVAQGTQPNISEQRTQAVNWQLHKQLLQQSNNKTSWFTLLARWINQPRGLKFQFVSIVAMFFCGYLVAQINWRGIDFESINGENIAATESATRQSINSQPTSHQDATKYAYSHDKNAQIVDFKLANFNTASGEVELEYSSMSANQVKGNLADKQVLNLLVKTLQTDIGDYTRLELVELLTQQVDSSQVQQALSTSLLNDPNPGVRMMAAQSLAKLVDNKSVREVLIQSLTNDINSGVRVEVFEALLNHLEDKDIIAALQRASERDSNQYIREQSQQLIKQNDPIRNNNPIKQNNRI